MSKELENKFDDILELLHSMDKKLSNQEIYQKQHRKELDDILPRIVTLERLENKRIGAISIISIIVGFIGSWVIKVITSN